MGKRIKLYKCNALIIDENKSKLLGKRYKHFGINKSGIYCEQVTMKRGMIFNV